jgi:hypothetical protein
MERELTRSHERFTSVVNGQVSVNREFLRVLDEREKMRSEVANQTLKVWALEGENERQKRQIAKLSDRMFTVTSVYKAN